MKSARQKKADISTWADRSFAIWISSLYIYFFMLHICLLILHQQKKKKRMLWDKWSGLRTRLPGPGDIRQRWCIAALPGQSEASIFINHSVLLLCPPRTNTGGHTEERTHKYTHLGPSCSSLPPAVLQDRRGLRNQAHENKSQLEPNLNLPYFKIRDLK